MVNKRPAWVEGQTEFTNRTKISQYIKDCKSQAEYFINSRSEWRDKLDENEKRRFSELGRNPEFPWPKCSDIVMPLADMMIDQMKPDIMNIQFGQSPMVRMIPTKANSVEKAPRAERFFEWLLRFGMKDFFKQQLLACDDWAANGFCFEEVGWKYLTTVQEEYVEAEMLPYPIRGFRVRPNLTQEQLAYEFWFSRGTYVPISVQQFDSAKDRIRTLVKEAFALQDNEIDNKAADSIMKMLRSGQKSTTIKRRVALYDNPYTFTISPRDLLVRYSARSLESESLFIHRMWYTPEALLQTADSFDWNMNAVDFVLDRRTGEFRGGPTDFDKREMTNEESRQEGAVDLGTDNRNLLMVYKSYGYYDINGDGRKERCCTLFHPESDIAFKMVALQDQSCWPVVQTNFEMNKPAVYASRGITIKVKDFQDEMTKQKRAKIDRMTIANSPTFLYLKGAGFNPFSTRWIPGDFYGTTRMDAMRAIEIPNLDISFDREINNNLAFAESYIGRPQFSSGNLSNVTEAKTATEVAAADRQSGSALGYRGMLWQDGRGEVYRRIWKQYQVNGPDYVWVAAMGEPPERMAKSQVMGDFDLIPVGTVGNLNPMMEQQRAMANVQLVLNWMPVLAQDDEYEWKPAQMIADLMQKSDPLGAQRWMRKRTPQEMKQREEQRRQLAQQQNSLLANQSRPLDQVSQQLDQAAEEAPHGGKQRIASLL